MNNIKTKVISISVAVVMLLSMAALSITAVNAAEVVETTGATQTTDALSSTADSATSDSSSDSANGFIATGGSALMLACAAGVAVISGAVLTVANRRKETL